MINILRGIRQASIKHEKNPILKKYQKTKQKKRAPRTKNRTPTFKIIPSKYLQFQLNG